jgi:hypothetical protein
VGQDVRGPGQLELNKIVKASLSGKVEMKAWATKKSNPDVHRRVVHTGDHHQDACNSSGTMGTR